MVEPRYINLENFDQVHLREPVITSPRSIEACRRQGVVPSELVQIPMIQLKAMHKGLHLEAKNWELLWQHHEDKRLDKLKACIDERINIIRTTRSPNKQTPQFQRSISPTVIERERRQVEAMRNRQVNEIKHLLEHEVKVNEIRARHEEKDRKLQEKVRQREEDLTRKRQEQELTKMKRQMEMKLKEEEHQKQLDGYRKFLFQQEKLKDQEIKQMEWQKQRKLNDEEILQHHQQFLEKMYEQFRKKWEDIEAKRRMMDEKANHRHQQYLKNEQSQGVDHSKAIQEYNYELIERARENQRLLEQQKQERYELRQLSAMIRKNHYDQDKQKKMELKHLQEQERQEKRIEVKQKNNEILQKRTEQLLNKFQQREQLHSQMQEERSVDAQSRKLSEYIRLKEKRENVQRIMRVQDYERDQLKNKLDEKSKRVDEIKYEQQQLKHQRELIRRQFDQQKNELNNRFKLVQQGRLSPQSLSVDIGVELQGSQKNLRSVTPQAKSIDWLQKGKRSPPRISDQKHDRPKSSNNILKYQQTDMQDLKFTQNNEMIRLLEQEQIAERQREEQLSSASPEEQTRLEMKFQLERGRAQARIQKLQDQHEKKMKEANGF